MPINKGQLKEDEMIYFLNGKKINELSQNLRSLMENMFGVLDPKKSVKCEKAQDYIKPDIIISYDGRRKGLSIKSGSSTTVHNERLDTFIAFLKSEGISERTIETILLHHYGDGTTDGSGSRRWAYEEVVYRLKARIKEANEELNYDTGFILKFIDRVLFNGVNPEADKADGIYHGDANYGVVALKKQVVKHISRKSWDYYDSLHIGPVLIRPHARYVDTEIRNQEYRNRVDVWWPKLNSDIDYISNRYNNYTPMHKRTFEE